MSTQGFTYGWYTEHPEAKSTATATPQNESRRRTIITSLRARSVARSARRTRRSIGDALPAHTVVTVQARPRHVAQTDTAAADGRLVDANQPRVGVIRDVQAYVRARLVERIARLEIARGDRGPDAVETAGRVTAKAPCARHEA